MHLDMIPNYLLNLSGKELGLVQQGLNLLKNDDGDPLPEAQKLRDAITRSRCKQGIALGKTAEQIFQSVRPKDHDYGIAE